MAITFDVLDRFQENKVLQTAQTIIFRSQVKNGSLSPWKPSPFKLEVQKSTCLALIIQIKWLKQNFSEKSSSHTLILATCYSSIQSYFKIDLNLTVLFNVYFLYRKSRTFRATPKAIDKEVPKVGQE